MVALDPLLSRRAGVWRRELGGLRPTAEPVITLAESVIDMHTQEFVVLRDVVIAEHRRRNGEPELATV